MNSKSLILSLYEIGAVKFGDFTLKSGATSNIYLDLRLIVSYPKILSAVAEAIWQKVEPYRSELICGVPYTALPIATCISLKQNLPMVMRRKEPKSYGTKLLVEGAFNVGQSCLIIEDVITSGMSIMETAKDLKDSGLKVEHVGVLIDRQHEKLENFSLKVHAAFTLKDILQTLMAENLSHAEYLVVSNLLEQHETTKLF